jgi:Crp-like helix-turn-helix domain
VPLVAAYARLVRNHVPLTHEFLGQMIGVRRTSVTGVAGDMQRAGMISYTRGRLHIVDIELVRMNACECHDDVRSHYDRIMGGKWSPDPASGRPDFRLMAAPEVAAVDQDAGNGHLAVAYAQHYFS